MVEGGAVMVEMSDLTMWTTIIIFAATILAVITGVIDSSVAALIGVAAMVWTGTMTEVDAFNAVDWNVMAILISIWIIAGYLGKTGIPEWLSGEALRISGGHGGLLVMILSMLSGIISLVVDNVVVILMLAPVAIPIVRHLKMPLTPVILMIGFSSNFMGTALLLGDLPPQMLHSVSGAEFLEFIWQDGRPSSFPILMVTFVITLAVMYVYGFRGTSKPDSTGGGTSGAAELPFDTNIPDPKFAAITLFWFFGTIIAMALREYLGMKLGFIALTGAMLLILHVELMGHRLKKPDFEEVLQELDWRAVFFYIGLFALVGGFEKTHLLNDLANALVPLFQENLIAGASLLYWITVPIVGIVEHDAYILTFLYMIRDLGAQGIDPWPLWWMLVWSGTLGSNMTIAGAPALYVALNICEREEKRKITIQEFLKWSVLFTITSSIVCFIFGMLIWVIPNA
ncbi:MAG: permease [Gammaproteobacteria bacterium]|nr:permease [Gammaproteobacteria bacterium]